MSDELVTVEATDTASQGGCQKWERTGDPPRCHTCGGSFSDHPADVQAKHRMVV